MRRPRRAWLAAAPLAAGLATSAAGAAGDVQPGAYCPLPRQGETPKCLEPAVAEYAEFFTAVGAGELDDERLARVERDLSAGSDSEHAYLALSSLAYGYYRLSQRAARTEETDPEIAARLQRWNGVLGRAWDASPEDEAFRSAVREAAFDLRRSAPPVPLRCLDERGQPVGCSSTDAVVRGIEAAAGEVGIRGGLERLLERIVGAEKR